MPTFSIVEYAMEAISHAGTVLGILASDGVVLAAEKKVTGKLLDLSGSKEGGYGGSGEKIFLLNSYVFGLPIIGAKYNRTLSSEMLSGVLLALPQMLTLS